MNLQEDKKTLTEAYLGGINITNIELFGFIKENFDEVKPVLPLVEFIITRFSTVTDLAIQGNNWDAEIVYRSALECLIKLIFITSALGEEREKRIKEYWEDLRDVHLIKQSEQAKKNLAVYGDDESLRLAFIPMVLSEEQENTIRTKWTKAERQKLEQKWSFSEMIISISKNYLGSAVNTFIGLGHNYRYASHVSHADETGVLIIKEREERSFAEREIADFAHYIKHLSDTFYLCISMSINIVRFVNKDPKKFIDLGNSIKDIHPTAHKYLDRLHEDKIYDKFKK